MEGKIYEGKSENGDFTEALSNALDIAEVDVKANYVEWDFIGMKGVRGGTAGVNELTVIIDAWTRK